MLSRCLRSAMSFADFRNSKTVFAAPGRVFGMALPADATFEPVQQEERQEQKRKQEQAVKRGSDYQ